MPTFPPARRVRSKTTSSAVVQMICSLMVRSVAFFVSLQSCASRCAFSSTSVAASANLSPELSEMQMASLFMALHGPGACGSLTELYSFDSSDQSAKHLFSDAARALVAGATSERNATTTRGNARGMGPMMQWEVW